MKYLLGAQMSVKSCKVIILGDSGVGKTTLIHSFIAKEFRADFKATLGADLSSKVCVIDGQTVEVLLWDTAGTERFRSMGSVYYRGAEACIFVYDIGSRLSFEHLTSWQQELVDAADIDSLETFPCVLLANKSDLEDQRQVCAEAALAWADAFHCPHFAVSAKTGENVEAAFIKLIQRFLEESKTHAYNWTTGMPAERPSKNEGACC